MPRKKSTAPKSEGLTKEFFLQEMQGFEKRFDEKLIHTKTLLESKIEFYRKDSREQIKSEVSGLKTLIEDVDKKHIQRIGFLNQQIENLDKNQEEKFGTVNQKLDAITQRLDRVETKLDGVTEKVERHDEEVIFLKSAVSQT